VSSDKNAFLSNITLAGGIDLTRAGFDKLYEFLKLQGEPNFRQELEKIVSDPEKLAAVGRFALTNLPSPTEVVRIDAMAKETGKQEELANVWGILNRVAQADLSAPGLTDAERTFATHLQKNVREAMAAGKIVTSLENAPGNSTWAASAQREPRQR